MKTDPSTASKLSKPRCLVMGGFLGAGKTASIVRLGNILASRGHKVGVVTNDEGNDLVDTAQLRAAGFPVEEVPGGSLGARVDAFLTAARRLATTHHCDIFFAEAAGTSAELRATVLAPLVEQHGNTIAPGPLSVVVDAIRAARLFHLESGGNFSEKIGYIYRKQIEEAEILVLNKCDLIPSQQLARVRESLGELAPSATLCEVSARTGAGLDEWLQCLLTRDHQPAALARLDHEIHRDAEANLGWLNCTVKVSSVKYFDADKLLNDLATAIQSLLKNDGLEVAHLKLILRARNESTDATEIAAINMVRNDLAPELSGEIREPVQRAELILNLRAEARPDLLHDAVNRAIMEIMERAPELFARMEHCEHFRPNRRS